ncbi:hypothetical protein [Spirillospora sp. CA-294931]|uniref:hypothetical protein n=1 Tax=Spirillospora sp. CA-294931 TaxID=3240042 RepID=UPI003D94D734
MVILRGGSRSPEAFRFVERDGIDWRVWTEVLHGVHAGAIFRGVLDGDSCRRIVGNFWSSPILRGRRDGLPAHGRGFVGTPIAGARLDDYLTSAAANGRHIDALFAGARTHPPALMDDYTAHLAAEGVTLRLAAHRGRTSPPFKMRSWQNSGAFVVAPHEDHTVLRQEGLAGFEIQRAVRFCNVVACLSNGPGGGLRVWNLSPDSATRRALGLQDDGVGYPLESLDGVASLTVPVAPGDVYLFDNSLIHAVDSKDDDAQDRTNVLWSMASLTPDTILRWA